MSSASLRSVFMGISTFPTMTVLDSTLKVKP
jgi:hypothetical protein